MTNDELKKAAYDLGFARAYILPPPDFKPLESRERIVWNTDDFPMARASLLLVRAYTPFAEDERIPAYYVNSNLSYHASVALAKKLEAEGLFCLRCELPIKQLAVKYGIGVQVKSSLVAIPPFGTRMAFQSMLLGEPFTPEEYPKVCDSLCASCKKCEQACPAHAISEKGLDVTKCMRYYMDGADYPEWVYGIQKTHMGCEICQAVCPRNAAVGFAEPSEELVRAFDINALAEGNTKPARLLVGKNFTGRGKLQKEALKFLERDGAPKEGE
ncbi:MAG: hypothetical protein K6G56_02040 [Clostridiales bacterium]|nr:hypothetical protein [Clostridiales bacterium]